MDRNEQLKKIVDTTSWDIVVIGGGATGLGAAVDAANRGYKVLCLEKYDFSKGTSSRSTKLIHGGVRYLQQGNISMVKHALRERWFMLQNASLVTRKLSFVLPVYSWWSFFYYSLGLMLYDLLSGRLSIGKTRIMNAKSVISKVPDINTKSLKGGIRYFDGQFDDSEICIALARTAIQEGATVINHAAAESFTYNDGKISGLVIKDYLSGKEFSVNTKVVINATGVFADTMIKKDNPSHHAIISPSRGIHIVIDKKFYTGPHAMLIPKTTDGRVLYAVPWHDKVIIGTTDNKVENIDIEPIATHDEVNFVLENFNQYMSQQLTIQDIKSVFAGLRPLVKIKNIKSTADLVRDHLIYESPSGLVSITGGKWTTYRKMAKDVINQAIKTGGLNYVPCNTDSLHLVTRKDTLVEENTINSQARLHPSFAMSKEDVLYAIESEMACTLEDVLARRIRILFLDARAALEVAPVVCKIMQETLGKDDVWFEDQIISFRKVAENYLPENIVK